jgi:hypothetical protein
MLKILKLHFFLLSYTCYYVFLWFIFLQDSYT